MSYEQIDSVVVKWASSRSLNVQTQHQDEEVRSITVCSHDGVRKCQIWIDPIDDMNQAGVHVWNYDKLREDYEADLNELEASLEKAYAKALQWIG